MSGLSTAIIFENYGPYHISRVKKFRELYNGKVYPVQLFPKDILREWNTDHSKMFIYTAYKQSKGKYDSKDLKKSLINMLEKIKPEVLIIAGYGNPVMRFLAEWGCTKNIFTILISVSNNYDKNRLWVKEKLKGYWIRKHYDAAFVSGSRASYYLESLGFQSDQIWRGYDVIDNDYFSEQSLEAKKYENSIQDELGLPEKYFLYVGRFSREKNLIRFLDAYSLYKQKTENNSWGLVMVGSGPQEDDLKKYAEKLGLNDIIFPGFKQVDELPLYYALSSCFILPSTSEPWGLVVNEAMACGLPVLVSNNCGCVPELVQPGLNGYVFNPYNIEEMAFFMRRISLEKVDVEEMGKFSKKIVANFTPETWAKALVDCINVTIQKKELFLI